MALSLSQTQALSVLAEHLYSFLPGKAHPFADQNISFAGIAASLGFNQFWTNGSKLPAISQLLTNTLQYKSGSFCPLLIEIVRKSVAYRQNKGDPITREEINKLNELIAQVGFKIPELHDPKFLNVLPRKSHKPEATSHIKDLPDSTIQELKSKLLELSSLPSQEKGFQFEKFLNDLFKIFGLSPRSSFRLVGEQIDGSFEFHGETYLVEATWQKEPIGQEKLLTFSGKVGGKAKWTRGFLISNSGFSLNGLEAFTRGRPTNIICMDGLDLYYILEGKLDFCSVLEQKVRRAAETNQAYVSVRELFPNVS